MLGSDVNSWRGLQLADILTSACSRDSANGSLTDKNICEFSDYLLVWNATVSTREMMLCIKQMQFITGKSDAVVKAGVGVYTATS